MTATNGFNQEFKNYVDGWAEMMIDIWRKKMEYHWVGTSKNATGNLYNSLKSVVNPAHDAIEFAFNRYGHYVEAGIGPEMGENGRLGRNRDAATGRFKEDPTRKPKPWLSGSYWYSRQKLKFKMLEESGRYYLSSISRILNEKNN
jgi:hypothetical protein